MTPFSAEDAVRFAIRIEENGEAFYREAGRTATSKDARRLFEELAGGEANHRSVFEGMLDRLGADPPDESYPGEYLAHLRYYIDGKAVFAGEPACSAVAGSGDTRAVLDFALQRELDSMAYFLELRPLVGQADLPVLDAIVAEERLHFAQLAQLSWCIPTV